MKTIRSLCIMMLVLCILVVPVVAQEPVYLPLIWGTGEAVPTPTPEGVWVGNESIGYESHQLTVVGEVYNGLTDEDIDLVELPITLYDDQGQPVYEDVEPTYSDLGTLRPGESTCFFLRPYPAPPNWQELSIGTPVYTTTVMARVDLELTDLSITSYPSLRLHRIQGRVANRGTVPVHWPAVTIALKDAQGRVIGCRRHTLQVTTFYPGPPTPFSASLQAVNANPVESLDATATAWEWGKYN